MDLNTYLFFDGQCEEAFKLYEKVLGGKIMMLMRYSDAPAGGPADFKGNKRVMHTSLRVGDRVLMGSDSHEPAEHKTPQGFRANISVDTPADADRIYNALAEGGTVTMPIGETFFAHRFGMFTDRFGTPWMVICPKEMGQA